MARKILVVDTSAVMRTILRSTIHASLGDAIVFEAQDGEMALESLHREPVDLVLSSWELPVMDGVELFWKIRQDPDRQATPFVLITSKCEDEHLALVRDTGIKDCLITPFEPHELIDMINKYCNPVKLRASERYGLPGTVVTIRQERLQLQADLVNVSLGGLLCDLPFDAGYRLATPAALTITSPPLPRKTAVEGLTGVLVSLNILSFCPDHTPDRIRIAFKFLDLTPELKEALETVFRIAESIKQTPVR